MDAGRIVSFAAPYDNYKVLVRRSMWLSTLIYVQLPRDHPLVGRHYSFLNERRPEGIPAPPFELTYGGEKESNIYGFDHCSEGRDLMPRWPKPQNPSAVYTTWDKAKEEGEALMKYFWLLANREKYRTLIEAAPKYYCNYCCEWSNEATTPIGDKRSCASCAADAHAEEREILAAVYASGSYVPSAGACVNYTKRAAERKKDEATRAVTVASASAASNKGDAANAGALYAAMMAKKKGKGKGKGKK
ncbi:hypothetical protein EBZ80_22205 [bacterium]|nr:hypothetical protein [bacterium]